jgi:hypothetical protein
MKADHPAEVVLGTAAAERLGLTGSEEMLQLLSSMVLAKTVSPCESAALLAGHKVVHKTCKVVHIPTLPPTQRTRRIGPAQTVVIAKVDQYCGRPAAFEQLTLVQYFKNFIVCRHPMSTCGEVYAQDSFGNSVQLRPVDQPVRFSTLHPSTNPEGFFYNLLLKKVAFRSEAELLSSGNGPQLYYTECCLRGFIKDEEDLEVGADVCRHRASCMDQGSSHFQQVVGMHL